VARSLARPPALSRPPSSDLTLSHPPLPHSSLRSAVDDDAWTTLVSRSFPNARLPGSSADAAPPRKSCVPPTSTPTPLPSTAAAAAAAAPTWKRLYQFHHTLLYRCLVKGPPPRGGRPAMIRLAPGALFVALPLAVS